jgi:AraC-like DNA-binding protein
MTACGTTTLVSPDGYQAAIPGATANVVVTGRGDFKAQLTWLKLRKLFVFRAREDLARIAYMSFVPTQTFISFPVSSGAPPLWSGLELRRGDIVFHAGGERSHQRTMGVSHWGLVSMPRERLAAYGKILAGVEIIPPAAGCVLRPSPAALALLLRLHSKACNLAETNPQIMSHEEAARAFEQEFVHALVNCLTIDGESPCAAPKRRHADIMISFEGALSALGCRQPRIPELCAAIGVQERTLRVCCSEFLGMSPARYIRLRRLNMVRAELHRADPTTASVAKIARRYQFSELGRFAAAYRAAFGEMPSDTMRRSEHRDSSESVDGPEVPQGASGAGNAYANLPDGNCAPLAKFDGD